MVYEFKFPDVGEGIHEGEIVKWFVKEGDKVKADEPLGEIETDKAIVEMPSPKTGTILKLYVAAGGIIHVGEIMVTILEEGENLADAKKQSNASERIRELTRSQVTEKKDVPYTGSVVGFLEEAKEVKPPPIIKKEAKITAQEYSILATPAVRNLAKQLNVDINSVKGSAPDGRITIEDVQKAAGSKEEETSNANELGDERARELNASSRSREHVELSHFTQTRSQLSGIKITKKYDFFGYVERVTLHGIKKAVANKMTESIFTAVQLTNMNDADVTELSALREKEKINYEKEGVKLTFMPYIVKAVTLCLMEHPYLNASLEGEEIVLKKYYNIGVAVDIEDGLVVPVVKGVDAKDIKTIAKEIDKLANDARSRKINMMDLKGGSFTVSNLGSVGVEFFTPIINYPESAILGVGRIIEKPVARKGKIEIRKILPLSLTYDHRIVDGAQAARFMNDVIKRLGCLDFESPKERH